MEVGWMLVPTVCSHCLCVWKRILDRSQEVWRLGRGPRRQESVGFGVIQAA